MKNPMPTQVRSTDMTSRFSEIFSESILDLADPDPSTHLKSLLDAIESAVAEQLLQLLKEIKKIAGRDKRIQQYLSEYPGKFRLPPEAVTPDFDLWLTPDAGDEIAAGDLYLAGRRMRGWIHAITEMLGAAEHIGDNIAIYPGSPQVSPPPDLVHSGRLQRLRALSDSEKRLIEIFDQSALLMEIFHYVLMLRDAGAESEGRQSAWIVFRSFNLGSLARLCEARQMEPDVNRGRADKKAKSTAGVERGAQRRGQTQQWLAVYQEYIEGIRPGSGGANLSKAAICQAAARKLSRDVQRAREGKTDGLSAQLVGLLVDYPNATPLSHHTVYRHMFGSLAPKH